LGAFARMLKLDAGFARGLAGRDSQVVDSAFGVARGAIGDRLGLRSRMIQTRRGLAGGVFGVGGDAAAFCAVAGRQRAGRQ
jgi:hypothetical protein